VLKVRIIELLALILGELSSCRNRVADLSAIDLMVTQFVEMVQDLVGINVGTVNVTQPVHEISPNLPALRLVERIVVQG